MSFEGRFGASPREVRSILYRAAQNQKYETLTPMNIFAELERLVKDRTVYEFLQLEPRGKYHQPHEFISVLKDDFQKIFIREITASMRLVEDEEYSNLLKQYVTHVVASVKKEKIFNKGTNSYEPPSDKIMTDMEKIIRISGATERHREAMLGKIAAFKIDNPTDDIDVGTIFSDYLKAIQDHFYGEREAAVNSNFKVMLSLNTDDEKNYKPDEITLAQDTYQNLETRFGYDRISAEACLRFLMQHKDKQSSR